MSAVTWYSAGMAGAALVMLGVLVAAGWQELRRQPTCPCGCGRPPGQHNEPYVRRMAAPSPVIFIPGQRSAP